MQTFDPTPKVRAMDYEKFYSARARGMRASEIRELLKLTQRTDIISFAGGLPNPLTFPIDEILEASQRVLKEEPELALQYGPTEGYAPLREDIADMLNKDGCNLERRHLFITNGSQQGLDLLGRTFLEQGSKVLVGSPTYLGAISAFKTYNTEFVPVRSDLDGMLMESLEETILREKKKDPKAIRFIYVVPTFDNPGGTVMPLDRRKRLLQLAHEHDLLVVEDDPYGKLRFDGDHLPTLKALDEDERVIYLGTFSKILVPGFRLAWTAAPEPIARKMVIAKQATDLCTNAYTQFIAHDLMSKGLIDEHLPKIIALYKRKRDIMLQTMKKEFPKESTTWTKTQGGLFSWAILPKGIDTTDMLEEAVENKVAYVPGSPFFVDRSGHNTMRLNFSHPSDEKVKEGVERLAAVIHKRLEAQKQVA